MLLDQFVELSLLNFIIQNFFKNFMHLQLITMVGSKNFPISTFFTNIDVILIYCIHLTFFFSNCHQLYNKFFHEFIKTFPQQIHFAVIYTLSILVFQKQ